MSDKWDRRFLDLAALVASWSKDPSTKTGAVIVRPDRTVASLGYNGFPRGMSDGAELYADRPTKYARVVHCEMNAILSAAGSVQGCALYVSPFLTCERCAVHVIQAGIARVVAPACPAHLLERWGDAFERTREFYREAGVDFSEIALAGTRERGLHEARPTPHPDSIEGKRRVARNGGD